MLPYYAAQGHPPLQPPNQSQNTVEQRNMFGMNRSTDPAIIQLLQQMKHMEEKIAGLTLTNQTLQQVKYRSDGKKCEPKN